jgi:hypothetical protein
MKHLWTDLERRIGERRLVALRTPWATGTVVVSAGLLLWGCAKVDVTPLGSTKEGRPQFEITCNANASRSGACHEQALDACGGDYETLEIDKTGPGAPRHRVLLIACNR